MCLMSELLSLVFASVAWNNFKALITYFGKFEYLVSEYLNTVLPTISTHQLKMY